MVPSMATAAPSCDDVAEKMEWNQDAEWTITNRHVVTENLVVNCHRISDSLPVACHEADIHPGESVLLPAVQPKGRKLEHASFVIH